jgi:hypothetical protein
LKSKGEVIIFISINKVSFFFSEIRLTSELIETYNGEKDFLYRKLHYLYVIRYKDLICDLEVRLKKRLRKCHKDYERYITELLFEIQYMNENFENPNKYKK